MNNWKA